VVVLEGPVVDGKFCDGKFCAKALELSAATKIPSQNPWRVTETSQELRERFVKATGLFLMEILALAQG
jgi:hypothetical protein